MLAPSQQYFSCNRGVLYYCRSFGYSFSTKPCVTSDSPFIRRKREKRKVFYLCGCVCLCVWAPVQAYQGHAVPPLQGRNEKSTHCKNGYINIETTIIRHRVVGAGGDALQIGLLEHPPLSLPTPNWLLCVIQWVCSILFCANRARQLPTD